MEVVPIIYGPSFDTKGRAIGLCIYLGGRTHLDLQPDADFNWVQRIRIPDADANCRKAEGLPGYVIDNCGPRVEFQRPQDTPTHKFYADAYWEDKNKQSDFFYGKDVHSFRGAGIKDWIDPFDQKPFDYLFLDLPQRVAAQLPPPDTTFHFDAVLNPVRVDSNGLSTCRTDDKGPRNTDRKMRGYCNQAQKITYGFSVHRMLPQSSRPAITVFEVDVYPLFINGIEKAPAAGYVFYVAESSVRIRNRHLDGPLPMTFDNASSVSSVCNASVVVSGSDSAGYFAPPLIEPENFKKPFK